MIDVQVLKSDQSDKRSVQDQISPHHQLKFGSFLFVCLSFDQCDCSNPLLLYNYTIHELTPRKAQCEPLRTRCPDFSRSMETPRVSDSPQPEPEPGPGARRRRYSSGDPRRGGLRADRRSRAGDFLCPSLVKPSESVRIRLDDREEPRARRHQQHVLSDSENEEPITQRIRTISAFIRKTSSALCSAGPRSRSCTDPVEDRGKLKILLQPALLDPVGALTAGVLLSSENSRSVSVPILPPQRRLAWSAVVPQSQSDRGASAFGQSERSNSPDSNDSISEELNHFKPIVCSPCTPPKRLADGRSLQPRIIKATPRNLRELPQSSQTWFHTSSAVLQKWRQIELDRQTVSAATGGGGAACTVSVATHTSPVSSDSTPNAKNRRRLLFDHEETFKIKVPAIHPQQTLDGLIRPSSKRKQTPKRVESKRSRSDADANSYGKAHSDANASVSAQERADRAFALRLQRSYDSENSVSDTYFLRSANHSATRRRGLWSGWTNQSAEKGRSLRSSRRRHKRP